MSAPVLIVGAGPVGLALALGLARQGVRCTLIEQKDGIDRRSKAVGVHVRTREVFRQWGIEAPFHAAGELKRTLSLHNAGRGRAELLTMDFGELEDEADRPGILFLEQWRTEELLLEAVRQSGMCELRFAAQAVSLSPGEHGVRLTVREDAHEQALDAEYLVGCDGASSFVRSALALPFEGLTYSARPMLADIRLEDSRDALPWPRVRNSARGYSFTFRLAPGLWRIVGFMAPGPSQADEPSHVEVGERVHELLGPGPFTTVWASRFRIHVRSSPRFRAGRVFLAGDAAHVHSPAGGFGMNGGIHDAHNLAWRLAHAVRGAGCVLDAYDAERRAVIVESVSRFTDFATRSVLQAPAFVRDVMFALWRTALRSPRLRRRALRRMTMIDLDYPAAPRLPNVLLQASDGSRIRLYELLPNAPVILELAEGSPFAQALPLEPVIRIGPGGYREPAGRLRRLLGNRDGWLLVRPDAHIAWIRHSRDGMEQAVRDVLGA